MKPEKQLTEEQILASNESDYMNTEQLAFFKNKLVELREATLARLEAIKEQMEQPHGLTDIIDIATWQEESNLRLRIAERERQMLSKIQQALKRISFQEYGYCLESGEPIGLRRLMARPTAEFAADVKELLERKEGHYSRQAERKVV